MKEINVLYGTESGTAEEAAHDVVRFFAAFEVRSVLSAADDLPLDQWLVRPTFILCSTTGQGEFPRTISSTWGTLRMSDAPEMDGCHYAIFGLGDSSYAKYNFAAKMLHNRLKQLGAQPLVHRGLGNELDGEGYEQSMKIWLQNVTASLGLSESDRRGSTPIFLHKFSARRADASQDPQQETSSKHFSVALVDNRRMTSLDHFQAVHHLEFERSELLGSYVPGDSLCVHMRNYDEDVTALCSFLPDFTADEEVVVSNNDLTCLLSHPCAPFLAGRLTVRRLLTEFFDITSAVSRTFLRMLSAYAKDTEEKERLEELSSSSHLEEFNSYCFREKRNPTEVLSDFPSIRPPLSAIISALKPMQPRRFSISSSSLLDKESFSLTVARLEFVTPYGRKRHGLFSDFLCNLAVGESIRVSLSPGTIQLPEEISSPLVLVGPGTGFAPVRAILRHCIALKWTGNIYVFAGFRKRAKDFLYQQELEGFYPRNLPGFKLYLAFSRDQSVKRYVQHLMLEDPQRTSLATDLRKDTTCVFVCGNSKQMPRDIEDALRSVVGSAEEDIVEIMTNEGRLFMDTWSS
jgi:NADPH-ferrihemoprotein reductase